MNIRRVIAFFSTLPAIIIGGTVFFHHIEGWSWIDSYFFTVVTLSTVGYGELVPATVVGKIGTTVFIFVGLGIFAVAIQQFGAFAMRKREEHTEWLIGKVRHAPHVHEDNQDHAANIDTQPDHTK
ncbi:potassium channel family protein [Roseovarius indicus]|uniref:Potassium channel protein n=1 Tax=Roseovarius indicus TaxID=540747 RepID=A0A0T5P4C6_9RHOB|nr:potassium channel family protein [Roseovarius indicus]KRS16008.1 potassium channel protein [Roseovarius indicus]OAO05643.1 potassium channel protein [Roseovarius indicus]QEW28010.1 voltage-gated potassium channel [Roseovarius indicus]SFE59735.1 Ion channel [Roseovarius indicus]